MQILNTSLSLSLCFIDIPKKVKNFPREVNCKNENIFGKEFTFLFFQEAFAFGRRKSILQRSKIKTARKVIKLLLVAWSRVKRIVSRWKKRKGSSMNISGQRADG